jgi:hypothetical protein
MAKIKGYSLLNNVTFLYFIVIVFVVNLGIFMYNKDNQSIFLIACSALIVYVFNNNMIIVLLLSMLIVNSLIVINKLIGKKEGLENSNSTDASTSDSSAATSKTDANTIEGEPTPVVLTKNVDSNTESTIEDNSKADADLIKKINVAIAGVKSSSEKLQKLDPELDIDLKDINAKLNDLTSIMN